MLKFVQFTIKLLNKCKPYEYINITLLIHSVVEVKLGLCIKLNNVKVPQAEQYCTPSSINELHK